MTRRTAAPQRPHRRLMILLGGFLSIGALFVAAIVELQVQGGDLKARGENQRSREVEIAGYRGAVLDRSGHVLAASTEQHQLVADPQQINSIDDSSLLLSEVLGLDRDEVAEALTPDSERDRYGLVAQSLTEEQLRHFMDLRESPDTRPLVRGLSIVRSEERVYPGGLLARPVVGKIGAENEGQFGIEWQFEEDLQGEAGSDSHEGSAYGVISVGDREIIPPTPGDTITLTIDQNIQYVVEQALIEHCEETQAHSANAVVSHPQTGEILAMATVVRSERDGGSCVIPIYNAPLVTAFEPGSVIKLVTAAAAADSLGYTANTVLDVPTSIEIGDKIFSQTQPAAPYPISQIIGESMNVGTIMMAQDVGAERLRGYLDAFGFGQSTGLGAKNEAPGSVRREWYGSDLGSISIGQGLSANTVQLAMAFNTIANDGVYLGPKLIRSVTGPDGESRPQPMQESRRVVSEQAAEEVTRMLVAVVDPAREGTGAAAAIPGYTVAGKTGTAWQVVQDGRADAPYGSDGNRWYTVTFAGFLPAHDPQLSIVVVVDRPQTETSAGRVAAPVFADIGQYLVRILGIAPDVDAFHDSGLVRGNPAPGELIRTAVPSAGVPNTAEVDLMGGADDDIEAADIEHGSVDSDPDRDAASRDGRGDGGSITADDDQGSSE